MVVRDARNDPEERTGTDSTTEENCTQTHRLPTSIETTADTAHQSCAHCLLWRCNFSIQETFGETAGNETIKTTLKFKREEDEEQQEEERGERKNQGQRQGQRQGERNGQRVGERENREK